LHATLSSGHFTGPEIWQKGLKISNKKGCSDEHPVITIFPCEITETWLRNLLLFLLFLGCFFLSCHKLNALLKKIKLLWSPMSLLKPNELYRIELTHKILRYRCCIVNKKMHNPGFGRLSFCRHGVTRRDEVWKNEIQFSLRTEDKQITAHLEFHLCCGPAT
jgi:hypothetical protein